MQTRKASAQAAITKWVERMTRRLEGEKTLYPGLVMPQGTVEIDPDYTRPDERPDFVKRDDANFEGG